MANALLAEITLQQTAANNKTDYLHTTGDEAPLANELGCLDDIAGRGRGAGLGALVAAPTLPGLESAWSKERVDVLVATPQVRAAFTTGKRFSDEPGTMHGTEDEGSETFSKDSSITYSWKFRDRPAAEPGKVTGLPTTDPPANCITYWVKPPHRCLPAILPFTDREDGLPFPAEPDPSRRPPEHSEFKWWTPGGDRVAAATAAHPRTACRPGRPVVPHNPTSSTP